MSLMPPKARFLDAARARNWKSAYDECNGLNMVDMLECLQELGPDLLHEMRDKIGTYTVWGGPNMPRIRFAMDVVELRKITDIPGDLPADQVQNAQDFLTHAALSSSIRTSIVTLARSFVATAHYLWGTAGNQPGVPNGNLGGGNKLNAAQMRDPGLDPRETNSDKVLAVCIAVQPRFDGYNTCAGRSGRSQETPDLAAFLNACEQEIKKGNTDQKSWPGAGFQNKLFPRKYYFRGTLQNPQKEVWGESCANIRHFDCVGLVNYCYARHWYQPGFGLGISAFRQPVQGTQQVSNDNDRMDADILIKPGDGHIGMLYQKGENWYVVQAVATTTGLTDTEPFSPKAWDRYRMNASYLRSMHD